MRGGNGMRTFIHDKLWALIDRNGIYQMSIHRTRRQSLAECLFIKSVTTDAKWVIRRVIVKETT